MKKVLTKRVFVGLAVVALSTLALAQQVQKMLELTINGTPVAEKAVLIGGKTYVPLSSLKQFGFNGTQTGNTLALSAPKSASSGGSNQLAALEGCVGETLFNGRANAPRGNVTG